MSAVLAGIVGFAAGFVVGPVALFLILGWAVGTSAIIGAPKK